MQRKSLHISPLYQSLSNICRQQELRAAAIARFEEEQPKEAFYQFCTAASHGESSSRSGTSSSGASFLVKKVSKDEEKKKKKARSKKDSKSTDPPVSNERLVLADADDNAELTFVETTVDNDKEQIEEDDFFM